MPPVIKFKGHRKLKCSKPAKLKNAERLNRHIFIEDNLSVLRCLDDKSVDLVYLDPPFNSNKAYAAPIGSEAAGAHFKDRWTLEDTKDAWWGELADKKPKLYEIIHGVGAVNGDSDKAYLIYMAMRLLELHRVLKDTGSIYLHCDQTMSHSLKLVMDAVFGKKNYEREIAWYLNNISGFKSKADNWIRDHDIILFYSKGNKFFKKICKPYSEKYKKKFCHIDKNGKRFMWRNKKNNYKQYLEDSKGKAIGDVWAIPFINQMSKERTGFPTQKPLALLERIIKASCPEGGIVLDPFCGCATTCIAAEKLKRRWLGIDLSAKAGELVKRRLKRQFDQGALGKTMVHPVIQSALPIKNAPKPSKDIKAVLYGRQRGLCNGCETHFMYRNLQIDHIKPRAKGGQDTDSNLQLLCGYCNAVKGDRSMAYLIAQVK